MKTLFCFLTLISALSCYAEELSGGRKYALLVGVQKYDGTDLGNLKFCENDVSDLAALLRGPAYTYNRVSLLTRSEAQKNIDRDDILPTAENIRAHLKGLLSDRSPNDTVLLAFAGHGVQLKGDGKMYFCAAKCNLDKRETLICIDEIYAELSKTKANTKILLVDACRNDPLSGRKAGDERINSVTMPLIPDPPGGTVAMFSCSKGQSARENEKYGHGYLFKYLIDGMKGDPQVLNKRSGEVTWLKLAAFVAAEVKDQVKEDYGPNADQTPEVKGESIDLVLTKVSPGIATKAVPPEVTLPAATIVYSDSFNRADAPATGLGLTDRAYGGATNFPYTPLVGGATPVGLVLHNKALENPGRDFAGVQFLQTMTDALNIQVDLKVTPDGAGNNVEAGPYFRSRVAGPGDGLIGGTSAGYWVKLISSGEVKVLCLNPMKEVAYSGRPAYFDASLFHRMEIAVTGSQLEVALDGKLIAFELAGNGVGSTVPIPSLWNGPPALGHNDGLAGLFCGASENRGKLGGQRMDNVIVTQHRSLRKLPVQNNFK